jgi:hypothetical protein
MVSREQLKKIYDETALLTDVLFLKEKISLEERDFLLSLLEMVIKEKNNDELLELLYKWMKENNKSELDEIIKATALAIDFEDEKSLKDNMQIIRELLASREAD